MKKFLLALLSIFFFTSCQEDIQFNDPAFQVFKDNALWQANSYKGTVSSSGILTITATSTLNEVLVLRTSSKSKGTYPLWLSNNNKATYTENGVLYQTGIAQDSEDAVGEITISKYDAATQTVSGSFYFNVENTSGNPINFQYGVFYNVPLQ